MPIIFLIIAFAASFFYFGLTATLLQLACIGIGLACMIITTFIITGKIQPYRTLTVQSLLYFLLIACQIALIYYAQYITSSPVELVRTTKYIYDHPYLIKYSPYIAFFIMQTLFTICFIRAGIGKALLISTISFISAGIIIYISWRFIISEQTKLQWLSYIVQDLMGIYSNLESTEFYKAIETLQNQLSQAVQALPN